MTDIVLPAPLVPLTLNLRMFRRMPLDVVRLRDSETSVVTKGDEFRCAVLLWCASWHQVPAASLPDNDLLLADLAGFGRVVKEWRKVRTGALRGFVKCNDGRLYHKVLADIAVESWGAHLKQRWKSECSVLKKRQQRAKQTVNLPTFDLWITRNCPEGQPYLSRWTKITSPEDLLDVSPGHGEDVPGKTAPIEGKGSESSSINHHHDGSNGADPPAAGSAQGRRSKPPPKPGSTGWQAWVEREGARLGMKPGSTESWDAYGARVRAAIDHEQLERHEHAAQR